MSLWLERTEKQEWIKNVSEFNRLILLFGILGTGKTTLVRRYAQESNLKIKNYSFSRTLDISTVIGGRKELSLEQNLSVIEQLWQEFDLVIWDDIHHIKIEDRHIIIQFIKSKYEKNHIFISEENLQEELGYDVPAQLLEPFTIEEVDQYLNQLPPPSKSIFQSQELYMKTGGLPLLIQLSVQQRSYFSDHKIWLKQLSAAEQKIIWIAVLLAEGIEETSPLIHGNQTDIWSDLVKKNIFEKRDGKFYLTSALQMLLENEITTNLAKEAAAEILERQTSLSALTTFKLGLLSKNTELTTVLDIEPDDIEGLSVQSILFYEKLCAEFIKSEALARLVDVKLYRFKRLYLNCLFLSSKRQEALSFMTNEMGTNFFDSLNIEKEWFAYEAIYWMMRSARFEEAAGVVAKFITRASSPIKEFVTIEQALPHVQSEPDRAIEVLERVLRQLKNISSPRLKVLCEAQARYQLAIAKTAKKMFQESREEFKTSRLLYLQINKPYFAAFCLLNSTWTNYYHGSWNDFVVGVLDLKKTAEKYGFEYLSVGSDLLFSLMLFETGKDLDAFVHIDKAIVKAKKIKHEQMLNHCLNSKLKFEFEKANYDKSFVLISEIKQLGVEDKNKRLRLFEKAEALTLNDLLEEFTDIDPGNEPFFNRMMLLAGHYPKNWKARTPRDFLVEDELRLRKSKAEKDQNQFRIDLKIMGNRAKQFAHASELGLATLLSEIENGGSADKKAAVDNIKKEIQESSLSVQTKRIFSAWADDIEQNKHTKILERWQHWRFQDGPEGNEYQITTPDKKVSAPVKPNLTLTGLFIDDTLGEVFFDGKKIVELGNKPVLRQILIFLLENSPRPCTKASFAVRIWGESYSPLVHDPRVYTSIQRLRKLISSACILIQDSGYSWNGQMEFLLIRAHRQDFRIEDKTQGFIFEALIKKAKTADPWMKKSEIAEGAGVTDSTLKRALAFLVDQGKIERSGAGPAVKYKKKIS
jgi:hypothetical protein